MKKMILPLLVLSFMLLTGKAYCYEADVHFELTNVLCHLAGLNDREALIVASADQAMDDNNTTTAFELPDLPKNYAQHGRDWHALGDSKAEVEKRLKLLWDAAITQGVQDYNDGHTKQLIRLGQYLHFQQDYYGHRRMNGNERTENWTPYGPDLGHFFSMHAPDRIPYRPGLAKDMAAACYRSISDFSKQVLNKTPIAVSREWTDALIDALADSYHKSPPHTPSTAEQRKRIGGPPDLNYWDASEEWAACVGMWNVLRRMQTIFGGRPDFPTGTLIRDLRLKMQFDEAGSLIHPLQP